MNIRDLLLKESNCVCGNFKELNKFNFKGVYVICDGDEVVYIGSAYARTIDKRLKQYICTLDSGNTLGRSVARYLFKLKKYDKSAKTKLEKAIVKIKTFSIYAFKYSDLEYKLIEMAKPIYNKYGMGEK